MRRAIFVPLLLLSVAACGGGNADQLEQAAEQSDPAAAAVLENAADAMREGGAEGEAAAQAALANAGQAQLATPPGGAGATTPPQQAVPHKPGDPVPPPKTTP